MTSNNTSGKDNISQIIHSAAEWITIGEVELEGLQSYGKYPPQEKIKATLEVMELNGKNIFRIKYNNQYYTVKKGERIYNSSNYSCSVTIGQWNYEFVNSYYNE